jgi:hypothetical protein
METETEAEAEVEVEAAVVTMRTAEMVKGTAETFTNWEVGRIMGTDSEGTMFYCEDY